MALMVDYCYDYLRYAANIIFLVVQLPVLVPWASLEHGNMLVKPGLTTIVLSSKK